ncbi:MAG: hypothetical protein K2G64_02255, partial [Muribaculaceae bacterium]|nr:hypothetical protein [Muribaculaceae bacterium]
MFSGNADNQHCIDLSQLNRIAFNKDEMIISSSNNDEDKSVSLKYTHYHHLTIANAIPTNTIGV